MTDNNNSGNSPTPAHPGNSTNNVPASPILPTNPIGTGNCGTTIVWDPSTGGYLRNYVINVGSGWYTVDGSPIPTETVKKKESGCSCKRCRDFNEYAEPNQDDGSFICYRCRKGL